MQWPNDQGFIEEDNDYPTVVVLSHKHHTARTTHTCSVCKSDIEPGQRYEKMVMLEDDEFRILKQHDDLCECEQTRKMAVRDANAALDEMLMAENLRQSEDRGL